MKRLIYFDVSNERKAKERSNFNSAAFSLFYFVHFCSIENWWNKQELNETARKRRKKICLKRNKIDSSARDCAVKRVVYRMKWQSNNILTISIFVLAVSFSSCPFHDNSHAHHVCNAMNWKTHRTNKNITNRAWKINTKQKQIARERKTPTARNSKI